ncbi:MAG: ferrous iron transport protein A [Firmicutes bacterium]|nr:ferrous iron transport protein A [Bacillota bacterium]
MSIALANPGEEVLIKRITGKDDVKHHLNELGLNEGERITILQNNGGNVILQVKNGRIAIDRQLAMRIQM